MECSRHLQEEERNRVRVFNVRAEVKHQKLLEFRVGSLLERVSPNIRRRFLYGADKVLDGFLARAGSKGNMVEDSVPIPHVRNTIGVYPDTGESGEAYDAESILAY
jgi:hypothetical protein